MKLQIAVLLAILLLGIPSTYAQDAHHDGMKDMFVHPFLAHMAIPDPVGEVSLRITPFQERTGTETRDDYAFHIEAGLLPNLGLHVRSDGVKESAYSEVMLMYSFLHDAALHNGISVFGQISIPTGPIPTNTYKGLFGAAVRGTVPNIMVVDANMHFDLKDEMAEYESAFVFKGSDIFYPVIELRGEITENATTLYSLLGLKFRVADEVAWGVGVQLPVTTEREYDTQLLGTLGIAF